MQLPNGIAPKVSASAESAARAALKVEIVKPDALTSADLAAWRELCLSHPQFDHPLLEPDFAQAVGRVRDDARVAIWRRGPRTVGFLAYHTQASGVCRPIGAPFSDYHALINDGSFSAEEALTVARIPAFRFNRLVDPHQIFRRSIVAGQPACAILVDDNAEDVLDEILERHPKLIRNYRRLERKLEREVGELRLVAPDRSSASLSSILTWKEEQYANTGVHNVLSPRWVSSLFDELFAPEDRARALMVSLYAGDQLVAGHFGVRSRSAFQPWITSVNPAFRSYSPGHILLRLAILAMPQLGLRHYDLGASDAAYKEVYAQPLFDVHEGLVAADSLTGRTVKALDAAWGRTGPPGRRMQRRLEVIFATETSLFGKANGMAKAVLGLGRRSHSRAAAIAVALALEPLAGLSELLTA